VVGSAEEYGMVDARDLPVDEDTPLRPATPYAVSKVAQGYLALQYTLAFQMGIVRTRTFHHTPGRGESFAESLPRTRSRRSRASPAVLAVGNLARFATSPTWGTSSARIGLRPRQRRGGVQRLQGRE
jgi:GDP-4-dehydro-6-deoxy-D-mannose reductase